jgi:hypothetical protein
MRESIPHTAIIDNFAFLAVFWHLHSFLGRGKFSALDYLSVNLVLGLILRSMDDIGCAVVRSRSNACFFPYLRSAYGVDLCTYGVHRTDSRGLSQATFFMKILQSGYSRGNMDAYILQSKLTPLGIN